MSKYLPLELQHDHKHLLAGISSLQTGRFMYRQS